MFDKNSVFDANDVCRNPSSPDGVYLKIGHARSQSLFRPQSFPVRTSGTGACKCIYIAVYMFGRPIMATARVFKSGNSQAVRLPKKFRVKSSEVEIFRRGDEIVLREKAGGMVRVLDLLAELPADMFPKKRKDPHPQRRKGL
jgi:antitoxin VapB